ncbi:hypothetical protein CK203_008955 [Vitis vinifera]|uniref:Uncharacterized protein n=1 Tax=Vitis vinifera TaxID=29760 RepID=A0A438K275_VITVI|nr:hypothetical protein CK203_008955 [Vitis vinifera]
MGLWELHNVDTVGVQWLRPFEAWDVKMAASGGYRNGTHKGNMKVDRLVSLSSATKSSSLKSKPSPASPASSGLRRNSTGSVGGAKDDAGGQFSLSFEVGLLWLVLGCGCGGV